MTVTIPCTAVEVVSFARSQACITEDPPGSNMNPYGAAFHLNGVPWCAMFVAYCMKNAASGYGYDIRNVSPHFYYTPSFYRETVDAGWEIVKTHPRVGDIVFMGFAGGRAGIEHVGLCNEGVAGGRLPTIEGNTSTNDEGSQSNGGGVFTKMRSNDDIIAIVRPPYDPFYAPYVMYRTLKVARVRYQRGNDVRKVQRLVGLGSTDVDGVYGPVTGAHVAAWRHRFNLRPTTTFDHACCQVASWAYRP
jgi:peptidoglycan hydrolase-like protein with peptidoglycan-binding domain